MPKLTIDHATVEVPAGTSVLQAARAVGIRIPSLCTLEGVHVIGGCRVCLVEVEGARALTAACSLPVADGMKVRTSTPRVRAARRTVVELLLSDHDGQPQGGKRVAGPPPRRRSRSQSAANDTPISASGTRSASLADTRTSTNLSWTCRDCR